jgi:taurine dioxygenase
MLYAREVPSTGGDTLFASMYAAYEALSDGLKSTLEGLSARHSSRHVFGEAAQARRGDLAGRIRNAELATQDAVHPVIIRHPETGRKALYVNHGFTLGLMVGPMRSHAHCLTICIIMRRALNSRAAFIGNRVR